MSNQIVHKFENLLMVNGKKQKSRKLLQAAIEKLPGYPVLLQAIENLRPAFGIRRQRVAGRTYEIPVFIHTHKQIGVAIRWLITAAKANRGDFVDSLAHQIRQAAEKKGEPFRKKLNVNKFAESNKNFVRYRV